MLATAIAYAPPLLGTYIYSRWLRPDSAAFGETLAHFLERLGPTFIKLAQGLSSRPDIFPPEVARALHRLHDDVKPCAWRRVEPLVRAYLSSSTTPIGTIEPTPIACGSIAQVHRARLTDGTDIVLKIRRPGVLETILRDLAMMQGSLRLISWIPWLSSVPLAACFQQLRTAILMQTDLAAEAKSCKAIATNLAGVEGLQVLEVIPELSCESVLVAMYVRDGKRIDHAAIEASPTQVQAALNAVLRGLYQMIFVDGLVHADLHPANMIYCNSGSVVLIDFGLVAVLDEHIRADFMDLFYAIVTNDGDLCADVILRQATVRPLSLDTNSLRADVGAIVAKHHGAVAEHFEAASVAIDLFAVQRRHGLVGSPAFTMVIVSLVNFESVAKRLAPEMDFQSTARAFLIPLRASSFPPRPWPSDAYEQGLEQCP